MNARDWLLVMGLASLSLVATTGGVLLAIRVGSRPRAVVTGIGFSAGMMAAVSIAELLPQAYADGGAISVTGAAAAGAGVLAALHAIIPHTHLVAEHSGFAASQVRSAYLVLFGLVLHDLPEGFALATSYASAPRLGVVVAIAIAAHNLPEEFAIAVPAVTVRSRRLLIRAAVLSALAEPLGALLGLIGVSIYPGLNAVFLAFAAGAMLFVSAHELAPMARRMGRVPDFVAGGLGAVALTVILQLAVQP
jgi:ZIP family zinc transporter